MVKKSLPQEPKPKRRRRRLPPNVFERDGHWYVKIRYRDEGGNRHAAVRKCAKNPTDAKEVREALQLELKQHGHETLRQARKTFADVADHFEKVHLVPALFVNGRKASGRRSVAPAKSALKALRAYFGTTQLRSITHSSLEAYKHARLKQPVVFRKKVKTKTGEQTVETRRTRALATVDRELELLRHIFTIAVEDRLLTRSPFRRRDALISAAMENQRQRIITPNEETLLLGHCTGDRAHLRPLLICALDTGMRWGEMVKMRVGDVLLDSRIIVVEGTHTKTLRGRTVGITVRLAEELRQSCEGKEPGARVFQYGSVKTAWATLRRLAGLTDIRWHDLRHTNATRIERSGAISHGQLSQHLGHTNLRTTSRYINQDLQSSREIVEALERGAAVRHAEREEEASDTVN